MPLLQDPSLPSPFQVGIPSSTVMATIEKKVSEDPALARVSSIEKADYESDHSDKVIEGSEGVTEHEYATLRKLPDRLPYASFLVAFVEFAERYAITIHFALKSNSRPHRWTYYGTTNSFNNYIRAPLPPGSTTGAVPLADRANGVAGALGQGVQKSFAIRTVSNCRSLLRINAS